MKEVFLNQNFTINNVLSSCSNLIKSYDKDQEESFCRKAKNISEKTEIMFLEFENMIGDLGDLDIKDQVYMDYINEVYKNYESFSCYHSKLVSLLTKIEELNGNKKEEVKSLFTEDSLLEYYVPMTELHNGSLNLYEKIKFRFLHEAIKELSVKIPSLSYQDDIIDIDNIYFGKTDYGNIMLLGSKFIYNYLEITQSYAYANSVLEEILQEALDGKFGD